ncbi:MAG: Lacal_2735 family protein [Arenicella sp.]|nr:Lacal_2735 family protein [Arenicella sp.]
MFQFLKSDPSKKLQKQYDDLQTQAFEAQRNGNIRGYSEITARAEAIYEELEQLKNANQ